MKILITGCAGFIGFHLTLNLLKTEKKTIFGLDNLNDYYDVNLKKNRLKILKNYKNFKFFNLDIREESKINNNFKKNNYTHVIHLAAQAGVRDSEKKPHNYQSNNIIGFYNVLYASKNIKVKNFLFASSSSVYGSKKNFPLNENMTVDKPLSFYAASKKNNENTAFSFSNIYKIQCIGLRFFTVYGPYGRPDMALYKFVENIYKGKKISLHNYGKHVRDWTYIDDVVSCIRKVLVIKDQSNIPYKVYNIGSGKPETLNKFIKIISKNLNRKAKIMNLPLQKGDVYKTHADITKIRKHIKSLSFTSLDRGIEKFIKWYKEYNKYE